jgi:anti-anti-sigma factor
VSTLRIDGELTIYRAAELHREIVAALPRAKGESLAIDLAEVTEIDGAGVQLLLAARKEAAAREISLAFVQPSAAVADAARLLGLDLETGSRA